MIASDDDRRGHLPLRDEPVEEQAGAMALAVPEPADARREALELDTLLRHADPAMERGVIREELEDRLVRHAKIVRIARQRDPAERPLPFAEERADEQRDEAADLERVLHA